MQISSNNVQELHALDPNQRAAAERPPGPLLIVGGPGSGKTRILAHRMASLVLRHGVPSEAVLAIAFSNAAAREMRQGVLALAPDAAPDITVSTFHAFALNQLRRHAREAGCRDDFTVANWHDQRTAMAEAMRHHGMDLREIRPASVLSTVSRAKAGLMAPAELRRETDERDHDRFPATTAARVWPTYQRFLASANAMDFDDLIINLVRAMEHNEGLRRTLGRRYTELLVDEFQEMDPGRYRLCTLLDRDNRRMTAVGDPDQSIYGWRGADPENIVRFLHDYPEAHTATLDRSYRSTPQIVNAARSLISNNGELMHHGPVATVPEGELPGHCVTEDRCQEARVALDFVADRVRRHGLSLDNAAVLFREAWQARPLEEACRREGIPYRMLGAPPRYLRVGGRDLMAYLRCLHNPADAMSFWQILNLPPRGINVRTRQVFMDYARDHKLTPGELLASLASHTAPNLRALSQGPREALACFAQIVARLLDLKGRCTVHELAGHILEITGLEADARNMDRGDERWENILELVELCREYGDAATPAGLEAFLDHVALVDQTEQHATGPQRLTLSTIHKAKGAEFASVAIVGLNEGTLPSRRSEDIQEERRLCYVGITRARRHLLLTRSRTTADGCAAPSRFIAELGRLQRIEPPAN